MKFLILLIFAQGTILQASRPFDASQIQLGRFVYRDIKEGRQIAKFTLSVNRQDDGTYLFTGDADGFFQHWEAVAMPDFTPVSSQLEMERNHGRHYQMTLRYKNNEVNGTVVGGEGASKDKAAVGNAGDSRLVHDFVPANTVDQRIDWAAMLSSTASFGMKLNFVVYDPLSGATPVIGQAVGQNTVTVPAGQYQTVRLQYLMQKASGAETYEIQITKTFPRVMIREEFPDGVVTELIEWTPATTVRK